MITKIAATNLKGLTFSHDVGRFTVFVGENASGKTARMDAIRLALWGYIPELGKLNQATAALASADTMNVVMEHGGNTFKRTWTIRPSGVKHEVTGEPPELPAEMLSPVEFFNQSVEKRLRYIFGKLPIDGSRYNRDMIVARIKRLKAEDHTAAHEEALQSLAATIKDPDRPVDEWLGELIEQFEAETKNNRQAQDRLRKAHEAQVQAGGEPIDLRSAEQDFKQGAEAIEALKQARQRALDLEKSAREISAKITALKCEAVACEVNPQAVKLCEDSLKVAKAALKEPPNMGELTEKLRAINTEIADLDKRRDTVALASELATIRRQQETLEKVFFEGRVKDILNSLSRDKDALEAKLSEIASVSGELKASQGRECDKCGSSLSAVFAEKLKMAHMERDILQKGVNEKSELIAEATSARVEHSIASKRITELEKQIAAAESLNQQYLALLEERDALGEKMAEASAQATAHRKQLAEVTRLETELALYRSSAEKLAMIERQIAGLSVPDTSGCKVDIEAANTKLPELEAKQVELERIWKKALGQQQQAASLRKLLGEVAKAEAATEISKLIVKDLITVRNEMVERSVAPLMERANLVAGAVLKTLLKFKDGDIGRIDHAGRWVPWVSFSGTEQAVTFAAFAYALASESPFKLVYLDEMGRLSPANKKRLVSCMVRLVESGAVDQFFCVDTVAEPYTKPKPESDVPLPGVTLIRV